MQVRRKSSEHSIEIHNAVRGTRVPRQMISSIVAAALKKEKVKTAQVSVVIVSDSTIHSLNKEFLNHDYTTDVVTFSLDSHSIDGEIYISIDTARQQASEYGVSLRNELLRLAVHGTLHLLGYNDKTKKQREQMHELENYYLDKV